MRVKTFEKRGGAISREYATPPSRYDDAGRDRREARDPNPEGEIYTRKRKQRRGDKARWFSPDQTACKARDRQTMEAKLRALAERFNT